jgi:hypothetical protein
MPIPANFHNQEEAKQSALPDASLFVARAPELIPVNDLVEIKEAKLPLWVSVSEAAKLSGVQTKTIRRAIESKKIVFIVKDNRYSIEIGSVFKWLLSSPKSKKKFLETGIIQYFK